MNNAEGSDLGLNEGTVRHLHGDIEENHEKPRTE
jgi:hypothetical protein